MYGCITHTHPSNVRSQVKNIYYQNESFISQKCFYLPNPYKNPAVYPERFQLLKRIMQTTSKHDQIRPVEQLERAVYNGKDLVANLYLAVRNNWQKSLTAH